jgi:hypothetical protein
MSILGVFFKSTPVRALEPTMAAVPELKRVHAKAQSQSELLVTVGIVFFAVLRLCVKHSSAAVFAHAA